MSVGERVKAKVEIFYFGCCPWSYFFAYGGGFLDEKWTRTGGNFKEKLEELGVEVSEYNLFEQPELVKKHAEHVDPYNPFSNYARFLIDEREVSKDEFFKKIQKQKL